MGLQGDADVNPSVLLGWHEKVSMPSGFNMDSADDRLAPQLTEVAGTGCIVRVMTDRRVV